ncbi:MAG: hypothetical protein QOE90_157 [Thermoplasmata archaeon]|jgi:hypothetical protein|nr:hypothetical protein [Thermoplasmata archaeon]
MTRRSLPFALALVAFLSAADLCPIAVAEDICADVFHGPCPRVAIPVVIPVGIPVGIPIVTLDYGSPGTWCGAAEETYPAGAVSGPAYESDWYSHTAVVATTYALSASGHGGFTVYSDDCGSWLCSGSDSSPCTVEGTGKFYINVFASNAYTLAFAPSAPVGCLQAADVTTLNACGVGPACPSGLTSPPGPGQVGVVCGLPVPRPGTPAGVASCATYNANFNSPYPGQNQGVVIEFDPPGPEGDVAFCAGTLTGAPCAPGQPGVMLNNDPICAPGCSQGVSPQTVSACGFGPFCPSGVTSPAGPGQALVICGQGVSACSLTGAGPGAGWGVGANDACIGLPWAAQGAASPCPATATLNLRIYWGTTPAFAPGSYFDVCF